MPRPEARDCAARLEFARALFRVGRFDEAERCTEESLPHASDELRFDLGLLRVNLFAVRGAMDRTVAEAEALDPVLPRQTFARDAFLCRIYALVGRGAEAVRLLEHWAAQPIPAGVSVPARLQIVHAAQALGHLETARKILQTISGESDYDQWAIWLAWLPLELESGHLDRAERLAERMRIEATSDSYLYPVVEHISLAIAIDRGCGTEIVPRLNALTERLTVQHDNQTLAGCGELADDLATSGFEGLAAVSSPLLTPEGIFLKWRRELLVGTPKPVSTRPAGPADDSALPDFGISDPRDATRQALALSHAARAQRDALEGRYEAATEELARAIDVVRTAGLGRLLSGLLRLSAQVALAAGDRDTLSRRRDDLRALAAEMPSRRAGSWANWCDLLGATEPPPPEEWLALGSADHEIARLSAATLGAAVSLNRWECVFVAATRRRWPNARYLVRPSVAHIDLAQAWCVDLLRDRAVAPGCEPVDLTRAAATRSLVQTLAIVLRASKQELAERVWGIAKYHPLRDDKRMQVAMRKLRLRIERDPSHPKRIVTDEDGYRLNADAPLIVLAAAELANRIERAV